MERHGYKFHPLYNVWQNMRRRCYDNRTKQFKDYGGRGITVCDEWRNSAKIFIEWAMANGWQKGLTIDRNENNGNYTPENCSFKTRKENNRNKRSNVLTKKRAQHIRLLRAVSGRTLQNIGNLYGISKEHVFDIVTNKTWA